MIGFLEKGLGPNPESTLGFSPSELTDMAFPLVEALLNPRGPHATALHTLRASGLLNCQLAQNSEHSKPTACPAVA